MIRCKPLANCLVGRLSLPDLRGAVGVDSLDVIPKRIEKVQGLQLRSNTVFCHSTLYLWNIP